MTVEEIRQRLKTDTVWWSQQLGVQIADEGGHSLPFLPRWGQLELFRRMEEQRAAGFAIRVVSLKSRKVGISTGVQVKGVQRATQIENHGVFTVAHDSKTARVLDAIAWKAYSSLPNDLEVKPPVAKRRAGPPSFILFGETSRVEQAKGNLGMNSIIETDTAREAEAGRGFTIHTLHGSEVAFWPDVNRKLLGLQNAVADDPDTMIVLESTANGHNEFKKLWDDAEAGRSDYIAVFIPWWRDPVCIRGFIGDADREDFVSSIGMEDDEEARLVEQFGVTPEQLHWRRWAIRNKTGGDAQKFRQEYPSCLTAETRVSTEAGIIPIRDALSCRRTESGPIVRAWPQPSSPVFRLRTKAGRTLRGTFNHPISTPDGFVDLVDLRSGDEVILRPPMFATRNHKETWSPVPGIQHSVVITQEWGRWLGYYMGDGSWYRGTVAFACDAKDPDVVEDVALLSERLIGTPTRREIGRVKGRKGAIELRLASTLAQETFAKLGFIRRSGDDRYRRCVCVPDCIWRSPKNVIREFLRGLFEADGSASNHCVRFASSRQQLIEDVQLLLLGFGINARASMSQKPSGHGAPYDCWTLQLGVEASRLFHDTIGFVGARKRSLRREATHKGRPAAPNTMIDEVVEVVPDGHEVTYDFTIEGEHAFMANGILTHNSPEEAFIATGAMVFSGLYVSKALDATRDTDDQAEQGLLKASGTRMQAGRAGKLEVPAGPLWVPREATGFGSRYAFWRVWEHPQKKGKPGPDGELLKADGQYIAVLDPADPNEAEGINAAHGLQVIDHKTRMQVAELESFVDADLAGIQLYLAALYWNNAILSVEVTGGYGASIIRRVYHDYGYNFVHFRRSILGRKERLEERIGWDTNRQTKGLLEDGMAEALREGSHGLRSHRTAKQLTTFVRLPRRTGPQHGYRADLLMAYMIGQHIAQVEPVRPDRPRGAVSMTGPPRNVVVGY